MPEAARSGGIRGIAPATLTQRIVLTGFMGSGKSTVGRLLARQLRWRFVDADAEIEMSEGMTVAEVFRDHGEGRFRQLEHDTVERLIAEERLVLALGGGAIEDQRTREMLLRDANTRLVHLEASFETVLRRCQGTEAVRPVLADRANLEARYQRRLPLYREAHLSVPVDVLSPYATANLVLSRLGIQSAR